MCNIVVRTMYFSMLMVLSPYLKAQVNGTNLLEYQYGETPGDTLPYSSLYNRVIVQYQVKNFKAFTTLEQFHSPFSERNYAKLTQYSLQYSADPIEVNIGNFYETIGRGLLLRSYEIPGAILEDLSYRSRTYFHRDILGINAKFRYRNFSAKILYGKPLNNVFPPSQNDSLRRKDIIEAVYFDYSFKKQTFGTSVLRLLNRTISREYAMVTASGVLLPFLSYYTEFAGDISSNVYSVFSKDPSFAFYGAINFTYNQLGLSAEYKNYKNFLLGTGVNEPPALVREHSYKVLNRSTHVLQPLNENGFQLELFYSFADLSVLTLNNTLAINNFGSKFVFQEFFAEYDFSLSVKHNSRLFFDYAEDPFKLEEQRISAGSYVEWKLSKNSTLNTDYEFQTFNRLSEAVVNHFISVGYARGSKFVFNVVTEISNDRFLVEEKRKIWIGANVKYQLNNMNTVQLFAGNRRGGPACNAGVCYEVLDFSGIELRLSGRF